MEIKIEEVKTLKVDETTLVALSREQLIEIVKICINVQPIIPQISEKKKYTKKNVRGRFTKEDDTKIISVYKSVPVHKQVNRKELRKLSRELGRNKQSVIYRAGVLKNKGLLHFTRKQVVKQVEQIKKPNLLEGINNYKKW